MSDRKKLVKFMAVAKCPKCLGDDIEKTYCVAGSGADERVLGVREWLTLKCNTCGYVMETEVADGPSQN